MKEEELAELWAQIPGIKCKGKCEGSCGPIPMSRAEFTNLREYVGERIQGEAMQDANGNPLVIVTNFRADLKCPLLKGNRCTAYEQRPAICRLWGVVKSMRCPYGCIPDKWMTEEASRAILSKLSKL